MPREIKAVKIECFDEHDKPITATTYIPMFPEKHGECIAKAWAEFGAMIPGIAMAIQSGINMRVSIAVVDARYVSAAEQQKIEVDEKLMSSPDPKTTPPKGMN
jgi:hypothetical protein